MLITYIRVLHNSKTEKNEAIWPRYSIMVVIPYFGFWGIDPRAFLACRMSLIPEPVTILPPNNISTPANSKQIPLFLFLVILIKLINRLIKPVNTLYKEFKGLYKIKNRRQYILYIKFNDGK